jgi:hypothetical protein
MPMVAVEQVRVYIQCDADTTVTELLLDVFHVCALVDVEAGKGVAQIVEADMPQSSGIQAGVERFSDNFVGHAVPSGTKEDPVWHRAIRQQCFQLTRFLEGLQHPRQLRGKVHVPNLVRLGRRFPPANDRTADFEKLSSKIHIAPLQTDEFALTEARTDRTEEQGVVPAPPILGNAEQGANFVGCQRIDVRVRRLTRARHPSEMRHRIGRYESVIDRVLIRFFQGRENVVNGPLLPTLGDECGDQTLQVDPGHITQTAGPECRENVLTHHLPIPLSGGRLAVGLGIDGEPLREVCLDRGNRAVWCRQGDGFAALLGPLQFGRQLIGERLREGFVFAEELGLPLTVPIGEHVPAFARTFV